MSGESEGTSITAETEQVHRTRLPDAVYLLVYVAVMNRHTELVVLDACAFDSACNFQEGFGNLLQKNMLVSTNTTGESICAHLLRTIAEL
jgi:hypothetical protein